MGTMKDMTLECLGDIKNESFRYLDGRVAAGFVGLVPSTQSPFAGTHWTIQVQGNVWILRCEGGSGGSRFLDGVTANGTVQLVPHTGEPFSGTRWEADEIRDEVFTLRCLGTQAGDRRFLDGRTLDGTVGMASESGAHVSGTRWWVRRARPAESVLREHSGARPRLTSEIAERDLAGPTSKPRRGIEERGRGRWQV